MDQCAGQVLPSSNCSSSSPSLPSLRALSCRCWELLARNAWSAECGNHLHQIGYGVAMFAQDHNERMPDFGGGDYVSPSSTWIFGEYSGFFSPVDYTRGPLANYLGDGEDDVWQCPVFDGYFPRADGPTCGYAYNYYYLTDMVEHGNWWDPDYSYTYEGIRMGQMEKSSTLALFGDSARVNTWGSGLMEENWFWTPFKAITDWGMPASMLEPYTHFRHSRQANVVWADSHVSSMPPSEYAPLDEHNLGYLCGVEDEYFKLSR